MNRSIKLMLATAAVLSLAACAAGPARRLASSRHQRRNVSVVQPTFPAIELIAAHSDG